MFENRDIISSRNNEIVKWAASLADKKGRNKEKAFFCEGEKLAMEAIYAKAPITHIFLSQDKYDALIPLLRKLLDGELYKNTHLFVLSEGAFEKISTEKSPQGIICVIKHLDFFRNMDIIYKEDFFLRDGERTIALCSLRDPGNLGTIIRTAVAFGFEHIVLSADCADVYNPKTVRGAMGGLFKIKISIVDDLSRFITLARANSKRVFAAELSENAKSIKDTKLTSNDIIIIGNEGHGIPTDVSGLCDSSLYIPICENTESLNAGIAAALFMWELSK